MKKILLVAAMFMMFIGVVSAASVNGDFEGDPIVKINVAGNELTVEDGGVPAVIYHDRTMVPVYLFEQLGMKLDWDGKTYTVDVTMPFDQLIAKYGKSGKKLIDSATYTNNDDGKSKVSFKASFKVDLLHLQDVMDIASDSLALNAYQVELIDAEGSVYLAKTEDLLQVKLGNISQEEFLNLKVTVNGVPFGEWNTKK